MPRSSAQSDFVVQVELPDPPPQDDPDPLPRAVLRSSEASAFATRWVMRMTWLVLAALAILCAVGPHIPSGE